MGKTKPIKKIVQLVTQSNERFLLPRLRYQEAFQMAQIFSGETNKNPKFSGDLFNRPAPMTIFIKPNGEITTFRGTDDKRKILHIQQVKYEIRTKDRKSHRWSFIFPKSLYLDFVNKKTREALEKFVRESGFCVFPFDSEHKWLINKFKEAKIPPPLFAAEQVKSLTYDELTNKIVNKIFQISLDFVEMKRRELENIVKNYSTGALQYHKLHWINRNMENVSDILFNGKSFSLAEISASDKEIEGKRTPEEIVGLEEVQKLPIVPAYRVYGHYALCCLEFYLDIMRKNKILICQNCGQYNWIKKGGNYDRQTCLKGENLACFNETQAGRQKRHRRK